MLLFHLFKPFNVIPKSHIRRLVSGNSSIKRVMELTVRGTKENYFVDAKILGVGDGNADSFHIFPRVVVNFNDQTKKPVGAAILDADQDVSTLNDVTILRNSGLENTNEMTFNGVKFSIFGPAGSVSKSPSDCLVTMLPSTNVNLKLSVGVMSINSKVDETVLQSLLSLVDLHKPSYLIHALGVDFDCQSYENYKNWFKQTAVNQHSFLHEKYLLPEDSSLADELKVVNSIPFKCNILPLKVNRSINLCGSEITTANWTSNSSLGNLNLDPVTSKLDQKRFSSTGQTMFKKGAGYEKMKKEYEQRRKDYSAEKKKDIQDRRNKVAKANQNSSVNSIGGIELHVLSNGSPGVVPAVALTCGPKMFLFNVGEGTQLAILEGSKRLKNIDYVLVGSNDYEAFSGLAPLMLTSDGSWGTAKIIACGSPQLKTHLESNYNMLRFLENCEISNVEFKDILTEPIVDTVQIEGLKISSSDTTKNHSVCFLCHLPERPGSFSIEKAKEFGIKPGPLVGRIKRGETLTLEDGSVVRPEDVLESAVNYGSVAVVDIQDDSYVDSLIKNEAWSKLGRPPSLIVHFTPQEVVENEVYQQFVKKLSGGATDETIHLYLNNSQSAVSSIEGIYHVNYLLNKCCPEIFPLIKGSALNKFDINLNKSNEVSVAFSYNLWHPSGQTKVNKGLELTEAALMRADKKFFEIFGSSTKVLQYDRLFNSDDFKEFKKSVESWLKSNSTKQAVSYPRLVCLGTSSAGPSKYRNVSGYYIESSNSRSLMLDCGENSYAQMVRHFGPDETLKKLCSVSLIFISHTHADHIGGLPLFLIKRQEAFERLRVEYQPLVLLCPTYKHLQHLKNFETEVGRKFFDHDKDLILLCEENFKGIRRRETESKFENILESIGLASFDCVPVDHRTFKSFGCSFVNKEGFKVAYSGDTLPCLNMVNAASNADLLIHEATHTDDKKYEALCAKHTTISEAINVHDMACAKFTLLTHFTHRYSKCIPLDLKELEGRDDIGIAFDHLDVTPDKYELLPKLIEGYKMVFQDHLEKFKETVNISRSESNGSLASESEMKIEKQAKKKVKLETESQVV